MHWLDAEALFYRKAVARPAAQRPVVRLAVQCSMASGSRDLTGTASATCVTNPWSCETAVGALWSTHLDVGCVVVPVVQQIILFDDDAA